MSSESLFVFLTNYKIDEDDRIAENFLYYQVSQVNKLKEELKERGTYNVNWKYDELRRATRIVKELSDIYNRYNSSFQWSKSYNSLHPYICFTDNEYSVRLKQRNGFIAVSDKPKIYIRSWYKFPEHSEIYKNRQFGIFVNGLKGYSSLKEAVCFYMSKRYNDNGEPPMNLDDFTLETGEEYSLYPLIADWLELRNFDSILNEDY